MIHPAFSALSSVHTSAPQLHRTRLSRSQQMSFSFSSMFRKSCVWLLLLASHFVHMAAAGYISSGRKLPVYLCPGSCNPGEFCGRSNECLQCPPGTANPFGDPECTNCTPGTYAPGFGNVDCIFCPLGTTSGSQATVWSVRP